MLTVTEIQESPEPVFVTFAQVKAFLDRHDLEQGDRYDIIKESTDAQGRIDARLLLSVMGY